MARIKTGNKLNVVVGTKSQIDSDTTIPNNSIIIKTDDNESGGGLTVETWNTATKFLTLSDSNKLFVCNYTNNQALTIPENTTVEFPIGTMITFLLTSTYKVTFFAENGVTLTSIDSLVELATQYGMASLIKTDTDTWQLVGALE